VAAHRSSHQTTYKKLDVLTCDVVSGDVLIGWVSGDGLAGKVRVQNCGRTLVKPKNQPGGAVLAPQCLK